MGCRPSFAIMAACLDVVTPRVQTINNDPMATCTGHFTAGGSINFRDNRWVAIINNVIAGSLISSGDSGAKVGGRLLFVFWGVQNCNDADGVKWEVLVSDSLMCCRSLFWGDDFGTAED
ncbi:hypothetical protein TNCV_1446391 [Trichonephila clavipes]|nr:hypothetical protein TNCV_1446391 [Trichonephila clavipes]